MFLSASFRFSGVIFYKLKHRSNSIIVPLAWHKLSLFIFFSLLHFSYRICEFVYHVGVKKTLFVDGFMKFLRGYPAA